MPSVAEKWLHSTRAGNPISALTTELNSLPTTGTATSAAIDNDADLDTLADVELAITYGTNPTANSTITLHVLRTVDGTNFESAGVHNAIDVFVLAATTSLQRLMIRGVPIPPRDFKFHVVANTTGQTAAASGNTLKAFFYGRQSV